MILTGMLIGILTDSQLIEKINVYRDALEKAEKVDEIRTSIPYDIREGHAINNVYLLTDSLNHRLGELEDEGIKRLKENFGDKQDV